MLQKEATITTKGGSVTIGKNLGTNALVTTNTGTNTIALKNDNTLAGTITIKGNISATSQDGVEQERKPSHSSNH